MNIVRKLEQIHDHVIELEAVKQAAKDLINATADLGNLEVSFNCNCDPNKLPCQCQVIFQCTWNNLKQLIED